MTAIAIQRRDEILAGLAQGQYVKDLASALQVSSEAISQVLRKDPAYIQAREVGMERRLERFQEEMETSADALDLARAREGFKAQAWRCEREFPNRWGQKVEHQVTVSPVLNILTADLPSSGQAEIVDNTVDKSE